MQHVTAILLPTRPQPDTIVAIFLLKKFGRATFRGIENAEVKVQATVPAEETFDTLLQKGTLALDMSGGVLDHHGSDACASELVAHYLGIEKDPALAQLLQYAKRDDKEGKGTLSQDAIDRAFGLSGLIASFNKSFPDEPQKVVESILPLLEAHYNAAREHKVEIPRDIAHKKQNGMYEEFVVRQGRKELKVVCVVSDKPSMPGYLRSMRGGRADVVLQKSETTNHMCVLTKQERKIDLSKVAGLVRMREAELLGVSLPEDDVYVTQTGRVEEVGHWYYDPATNSLLNGGVHNKNVQEPVVHWEEMKRIVAVGLELGTHASDNMPSYYLSINIPQPIARILLASMNVAKGVRLHGDDNLHITLEYFGPKTADEVEAMAERLQKALEGKESFTLILRDTQLSSGPVEGYMANGAWYLAIDDESGARHVHALRTEVLRHLGFPARKKILHVTLSGKPHGRNVPHEAVAFAQPFETPVVVNEVTLMESIPREKGREYRPYRVYTLSE